MTAPHALLLFFAAVLGGALNSVAGGGSFISFPALVFTGAPVIPANATNTVALWPGSVASAGAYRREMVTAGRLLLLLCSVSVFGGYLGALLLLGTRPATFKALLPWLMLAATLLFTFGGEVTKRLRTRIPTHKAPSWMGTVGVCLLQFVISVYGGYFGGGIGILMLATLALMGMTDIHTMNALKTVLASLINGIAVVTFVAAKQVLWAQASVMIVGAILGGYAGASLARRLNPGAVRTFVIVVGFAMTAAFFWRELR
jgi:uncharacterized protein